MLKLALNFLIKSLAWCADWIENIVDVNFYVWAFRWNIVSDTKICQRPNTLAYMAHL